MTFLCMNEIRKLDRVAHEEHRRVVANQIPVAFLSVEFQGKAAHIALSVRSPHLAGNSGKTCQHWRAATRLERLGPGILGNIAGDDQCPIGTPPFGVDCTLRNALAVLMTQFFNELVILHQKRAALACTKGVLVVRYRSACTCRHYGTISHGKCLSLIV